MVLFFIGRYRSNGHLVADIRYVVDAIMKKVRPQFKRDSERTKLAELHATLVSFLDDEFGARVVVWASYSACVHVLDGICDLLNLCSFRMCVCVVVWTAAGWFEKMIKNYILMRNICYMKYFRPCN